METVRPSWSSTMSSSRVMRTCRARAAVSIAKVLMPSLQEFSLMIDDQSLDLPELDSTNPRDWRKGDLLQPELRQPTFALNVDMWRPRPLVAVEKETIGT